jgi:hypothetical protein
MEITAIEPITPNEDVVVTVDFDNGKSIDIVSIDKHLYGEYETIEKGFEAFVFLRDGTGDYTPTGDIFKTIGEVKDLVVDAKALLNIMKYSEE